MQGNFDRTTTEKIARLKTFLTEERINKLEHVVSQRSRAVSVYLENIHQPHNASAVLRSCDAFGVQDVYVREEHNVFRPNPHVSLGSSKWLTLTRISDSTEAFYIAQKKKGYTIIATTLSDYDCTIDEINESHFPAIVAFGNELKGLSDTAISNADYRMHIPMYGFVESFNISVSVALVLAQLRKILINSSQDWSFTPDEQHALLFDWLKKDVHKSHYIVPDKTEES